MAIRISIACPICGEADQVSPSAIGTKATCGKGHAFVVRRDGGSAVKRIDNDAGRPQIGMAEAGFHAPARHRPHDVAARPGEAEAFDLRQVEYVCTATGKPFTSIFRRIDPGTPYQFERNQKGTGSLYRAAYDDAERHGMAIEQEPEEEHYAVGEFDFTGWACGWCGNEGRMTCSCDTKLCRGEARAIAHGYRCRCPACGDVNDFTGKATTVSGMSARLSRPATQLGSARPDRAAIDLDSAPASRLFSLGNLLRLPGKR